MKQKRLLLHSKLLQTEKVTGDISSTGLYEGQHTVCTYIHTWESAMYNSKQNIWSYVTSFP